MIVTDSFGRPWRAATTDVAIGAAGVEVVRDLVGERDPAGYELHATRIAVADEIAGAAQLVFGKLDRVPVAVVRGLDVRGDGRARRHRHPARDGSLPLEHATRGDAIEQANALLRERGYAERDLAVHTGPRGKALLKGNKILSPLSDDAEVVLRVVRELVPTDGELGAKILRPAELRAKL